ncbi:MAG: LacI family DNA-binding transcriptional regulator [Bacteroidota bacterium]
MGKHKATITDIARALQVTPSTVSRALNNHPRISEATRKKVLRVAHELNYQPNGLAAALRKGHNPVIGVVVPTINRAFFSNVIFGIEQVAKAANYSVIITQSNDSEAEEARALRTLAQAQVAGMLVSMARNTQNTDHFQRVLDDGIPLLLYDRVLDALPVNTVALDDRLGAYKAVSHLIEQGCRRIAHFSGPAHLNIYRDRMRGYRDALEDHGLAYDPSFIRVNDMQQTGGRASIREMWEEGIAIDAVFSSSDLAALGAMQWLKEQGIAVPHQVALVGFANEPLTDLVEPGLSSVEQHSQQMGELAAQVFLEQLQNPEKFLKRPPHRTVINPLLIVRGSSCRQE